MAKEKHANRANAQKSTGPITTEGKVIASQNAVRSSTRSPVRQVSAVQNQVRRYLAQVGQYRFKRRSIAVDVGDNGNPHYL
jgi:hypothetical protein